MKLHSIKKLILTEKLIVTSALIIFSFSFFVTEWKTIATIAKGVIDLAKSLAEKMMTGLA